MPAGLDSDGKSLGGQQGPAFLRAAGRRYLRRWVSDEHGEQFGKGEAGMLHESGSTRWWRSVQGWADADGASRGCRGGWRRSTFWSTAGAARCRPTPTTRSGEVCESKALAYFLGLYARRRRRKTYERIERAREDERIPLNRKARETLAWVLANTVMHDEDEL